MIAEKLGAGRSVLLEIGADWCLTCHYNGVMTLTDKNLKIWNEIYNMDFVKVDWTNYNKEVLDLWLNTVAKDCLFIFCIRR